MRERLRERLGAGVYITNNQLEFDIPELLRSINLEDTEENRDMAVAMAERVARESGLISSTTKVIHRHKHLCPHCGQTWPHDGKRNKCALGKRAFCSRCNP